MEAVYKCTRVATAAQDLSHQETLTPCLAHGGGERKPGGGRKAELERDAYQIQLVVYGMENRLGHAGTHLLVQIQDAKWPSVSRSQCSMWNGEKAKYQS